MAVEANIDRHLGGFIIVFAVVLLMNRLVCKVICFSGVKVTPLYCFILRL